LVSCVIFNDIFAFLIGSKFGKTKYSKISPNKSLEGNIAGISFGLVFGFLTYYFLVSKERVIITIIITLLLNISCQIGDLLFSKIKREHNIKDFSNLIPGHGGILDRFDSLLLTTLVYALIIAVI
jgi:phosphatidate cytidylyltransferase